MDLEHLHPASNMIRLSAKFACSKRISSVQFSSVQFSSVQFSSVQFSSVQFSSVQFSSVQFSSVQFSSVQFSSVQFSSVQFSSVQFSSVQSIYFKCSQNIQINLLIQSTTTITKYNKELLITIIIHFDCKRDKITTD